MVVQSQDHDNVEVAVQAVVVAMAPFHIGGTAMFRLGMELVP